MQKILVDSGLSRQIAPADAERVQIHITNQGPGAAFVTIGEGTERLLAGNESTYTEIGFTGPIFSRTNCGDDAVVAIESRPQPATPAAA